MESCLLRWRLPFFLRLFIATPAPFREPVNWRELGLDDYPKIVKKPMALADVKAKLANGSYRSAVRSAAHTRAYHPNFLGRFGVASVGDGSDDRCGMSCVGVQLLVPIAASLSPPPPLFFLLY